MELSVYELMNILQKIEDKNTIVKFKSSGKPDCDIEDIKIVGFLGKEQIVRVELEDA